MELRHLRYFVAVAEELSFTRASERLLIAQPSLSTQLRQLEREIGVELFDRSRRSIRLTDAGHVLLEDARQLLQQLDRTVEAVRRIGRGEVGQLSVGFVPSASNRTLPPILRAFQRDHPEVELFLREQTPDELLRALHERRIDVAFLYLPFEDETLGSEVVSTEALVVALPAGHRLADAPSVDMAELADDPFVLPRHYPMPGLESKVLAACEKAGFAPKVVQKDVWLMQTIVGLVGAGIGVALVPASEELLHRDGVVYRPLRGDVPSVELGAAWRRDDASPLLRAFLDTVRAVTSSPAPEAPPPGGRARPRGEGR